MRERERDRQKREEIWERERRERRESADIEEREEREEREPDRYYISETDKQAKDGKKGLVKLHIVFI